MLTFRFSGPVLATEEHPSPVTFLAIEVWGVTNYSRLCHGLALTPLVKAVSKGRILLPLWQREGRTKPLNSLPKSHSSPVPF